MEGISSAMARIDSLRSQLGMPVNNGASFQSVLDAQVSSFDLTTAPQQVARTSRTLPSAASTLVGANGVVTAGTLEAYATEHRLDERNGRLEETELQTISGGWGGRNVALIPPAADAYEMMRAAAAADGIDLQVVDAYRSWEVQAAAYEDYLAGRKHANVLPPGTSEHGMGMAVDFTNGAILNEGGAEWQWLQQNGRSYGWYPISNEAWHWEFRGTGA